MRKGIFITLEGIDFSGKSTQAKYILKLLKKNNIDYVFLREPGGTKLSERVRHILLNKGEIDICPKSELWLYLAARSQLVQEEILPVLKKGGIVICDRFYDSTIAYQAYGRGLDKDFIKAANLFAADNLVPDLTIFFDITADRAFKRKSNMKRVKDRLENEQKSFFRKIRKGYLELTKNNKRRFKVIDGSKSISKVRDETLEVIVKFLAKHNIRITDL